MAVITDLHKKVQSIFTLFYVKICKDNLLGGCQKTNFLAQIRLINCLHICHNKYSVWACPESYTFMTMGRLQKK